jgi:hypothetical protein
MNKHGFTFTDTPIEQKDCGCWCTHLIKELNTHVSEIPEDIVSKIKAICPECGDFSNKEKVIKFAHEIADYCQKNMPQRGAFWCDGMELGEYDKI